ncbi:MAG: alpha-N-arabinofuranosidase [Hyphomicrobiales bacterium]|nr:alpha-N-arabinofuranosidase [Hyphomicrobiales bacterium]
MKAFVTAHSAYEIAPIDDRIYGAFLEHLGRAIYTGIFEPGHPAADADGMRADVMELVRELNPPLVRYPGGNFVSAYNWEDGVGPRASRPTRLDLAWHTSESNAFGTHEFTAWCKRAGTAPMLAINLGSRGLEAARNFVEYVNGPLGSAWGDLRKAHGHPEPFGVKYWCLGNEMDGPWQIGQKTADEYGRLAAEVAKAMRAFDKSLELVVCGSSSSDMPGFPEWERIVLEHTYDVIDHISLHMYVTPENTSLANYLALNQKLERYIGSVAAVIETVRAKRRSKRRVTISFDEWNVWYPSRLPDRAVLAGEAGWPHAPRLHEDVYDVADMLQVGCIINSFIRRADIVKIACIAQLVNVIAPIMTEPGGPTWRQTIFHPYHLASTFGRGTALKLAMTCPAYDAEAALEVPWLDIAGVRDAAGGFVTVFAINRNPDEALELCLELTGFGTLALADHRTLASNDLSASNSMTHPDAVTPRQGGGARLDACRLTASLPPLSYHMLRLRTAG